jgi:hypothetical protein
MYKTPSKEIFEEMKRIALEIRDNPVEVSY